MRSATHPIEITRREGEASARSGRAPLRGFYDPEADIPGEPKLIVGDAEKFERDLAAYKKRLNKRGHALNEGSASRWWVEAHAY